MTNTNNLEQRYQNLQGNLKQLRDEKVRLEVQLENSETQFNETKQELEEDYGKTFKSVTDIKVEKEAQEKKLEELISSVEEQI